MADTAEDNAVKDLSSNGILASSNSVERRYIALLEEKISRLEKELSSAKKEEKENTESKNETPKKSTPERTKKSKVSLHNL
jgi:predicted nuclease of restriction endonuclease-like (RecB) superfamily